VITSNIERTKYIFLIVIIEFNIDDIITCQMSVIRQLYTHLDPSIQRPLVNYKDCNIVIIICLIVGRIIIIKNILKFIY